MKKLIAKIKLFKYQLTFFERGSGYEGKQSHYVLLAWHPYWSITWAWLLWWWPSFSFRYPLGTFHFAKQKTMPEKKPNILKGNT